MFLSYNDTKEKLEYLKTYKDAASNGINIAWLMRTLEQTNEKAESYEKALQEIVENGGCYDGDCDRYRIAKNVLNK